LLAPHWPTSLEVSSVDWPGYGKSPPLPGQASLGTLANTMSNLLPSDAIWVGWSLGGLLATALLDQLPAPQGLILIGAGERFCSD
ncbi:alpha/beta fold hydrolase, partial [Klebsiella pneumoniae]|uniref:alpha/beta fold hydrolase n=1 Tax=Klebsiella pneumoniae TaxID=573 RepID=UPI00351CC7F0